MWASRHAGHRRPAVLSQAAYKPISVAPEESQFVESQKLNAAAICRLFGVPAGMMAGVELAGHEDYSSPEQRAQDFLTFGLSMKRVRSSMGDGPGVIWWLVVGAAHLSIASSVGGSGRVGASGWPISDAGRQAARADAWGLAGRKGTWSVSMCQMASASLRAISTRATAGPRCLPSRCLVRW